MEDKVEIARSGVSFRKSGEGYNIFLMMQGHSIVPNNKLGVIVNDMVPIGHCSEDELEIVLKVCNRVHHNVEVVLDNG